MEDERISSVYAEMRTSELRPGDRIPMSWDEYEALGELRAEYIDGELLMMNPPLWPHENISTNLILLIGPVLPTGVKVTHGWGWKAGGDEFIPDLMVLDSPNEVRRLTRPPHLAVEILSSNRSADTVKKFDKYQAAGLERYWIIDPEVPVITEYRLEGASYREVGRHGPGAAVELDIGPTTITLDPADLLA